ncbi:MAG: response regulator transcription factor [Bryobacteraceae bacterium]
MSRLSIFACEQQPIVLEGLQRVLGATEDLELIGASSTLTDALDGLRRLDPDVLLVDQISGLKVVFQFLSDVRSTSPRCQPILWVQEMAEIDCFRALQMGARGIVKKSLPVETLVECLRSVARGTIWIESSISHEVVGFLNRKTAPRLTPREREIVRYICVGLKNKEIAESLKITPGTVKVHLMHIFEKTGVKDRFELAVHGRRLMGEESPAQMAMTTALA